MTTNTSTTIFHGIAVDLSRDGLFDELGLRRLRDSYMRADEGTPQQRYAYVCAQFGSNPDHAQRLYEYSSKHWLSFSTPILSYGRSTKGLPISCYLNMMDDSSVGLVDTLSETNWLSMLGGGVGVHVKIRSADDKSVGVMPHLKIYDASCLAYKQGNTRRGSYATYLDISHPDILQFVEIRKPTGDQNIRCLNLHHGINIPDKFMEIIERCMLDANAADDWELVDPASGRVVQVVSAKELWQRILEIRMQTGEPYLHFIDTANRALPQFLKDRGLAIHGSNLCLTGDTMIEIRRSLVEQYSITVRLDDFCTMYQSGMFANIRPLVKTWKDGVVAWSPVSAAAETATVSELIEITTPAGRVITCTPSHQIYTTTRGWVEAQHLLPEDELVEL